MRRTPSSTSPILRVLALGFLTLGGTLALLLESHFRFSAQTPTGTVESSSSLSSDFTLLPSSSSSSDLTLLPSSSSSSSAEFILPIVDIDWRSEEGAAVFYFLQRGTIMGYPDPGGDPRKSTFRGSEPISRAEAAKILLATGRIPLTETENNSRFLDVAEGEWYTPYVLTAAKSGIVQGYPPRHILFAPRNPVTTAEFLKMLTITFTLRERQKHSFRDVPADAWFAPYAGAAWQYKLFPERVERLRPDSPLARRDVILALHHLFTMKRPRGVPEWFAPNLPGLPIDTIPMHAPSFTGECPPAPTCPHPPKPECQYVVELDRNDCAISCGKLRCSTPQSAASSIYQPSSAASSVSSLSSGSSSASAAVANANVDSDGTLVPFGVSPFGQFRLLQSIPDVQFTFSITATNVTMSPGDFKIFDKANEAQKLPCSAPTPSTGNFTVSCPSITAVVGDTIVLEGNITASTPPALLQASFKGVKSTEYRS